MAEDISYFQTRDNLALRYACISPDSAKPSGTVVLLGGRAEFIEKHEETIDELNDRGLLVYTFDWRGQGLSSRLLKDRHKGHVESFSQYIDDLQHFIDKILLPNAVGPIIFLAHSMGGHITLRYLGKAHSGISGAVMVSPMINICTKPLPYSLSRWLSKIASRAGWSEDYILGAGYYSPDQTPFKNNPLTSDPHRFMDEHRKIDANPALALGGVTYGWLCAAFESIDSIFSGNDWEKMKIPVLMVGGSADRVVSVSAMRRMCQRLADCRCVILKNARHEILKETDSIRREFWLEFDQLVGKIM